MNCTVFSKTQSHVNTVRERVCSLSYTVGVLFGWLSSLSGSARHDSTSAATYMSSTLISLAVTVTRSLHLFDFEQRVSAASWQQHAAVEPPPSEKESAGA